MVKLFCSIYWQNLQITAAVHYFQKRPPQVLCKKMCSLKVRKYHRKIPVLESVFNKVPGLKACNFITKKVQHRCFSAKFLRTPFLTKHLPQWLVLCHCKFHLYRPRIFLTIPLYSNFIPCLFQLNFVFLLPAYIFL